MRIVLEGGGCRSAYTSGILRVLADHGISAQSTVGSSSGAMNAAFFAAGQTDRLSELWQDERIVGRMVSIARLFNPFSSPALDIDYLVERFLREEGHLDPVRATTGPTEFYTVATDLDAMRPVLHKPTADTLWPWLRASMAMPVANNKIVEIDGHRYVDTGVASPVPYNVEGLPEDEGPQVVILTRPLGVLKKAPQWWARWLLRRLSHPRVAEVTLSQHDVYNRTVATLQREHEAGHLILVAPPQDQPVSRLTTNGEKLRQGHGVGERVGEDLLRSLDALR